jgi:hypothetical protein
MRRLCLLGNGGRWQRSKTFRVLKNRLCGALVTHVVLPRRVASPDHLEGLTELRESFIMTLLVEIRSRPQRTRLDKNKFPFQRDRNRALPITPKCKSPTSTDQPADSAAAAFIVHTVFYQ